MKRKFRNIICFLVIISFLFSLPQVAVAQDSYRFTEEATRLHGMGLFAGASLDRFNPDLGAELNRQVGLTLLLNFFGKRA